jgi:bleomycin hydrolase
MRGTCILSICWAIALAWAAGPVWAQAKGGITPEQIQAWSQSLSQGRDRVMADIVAGKDIKDIALNRERYIEHNPYVNFVIKTGDITNQKSSGRCWMFAAQNVLRPQVIEKYKLKKFEFSENYLMFWDKLEKINFFLQGMIDMADRPIDDRELEILIKDPMGDGGWWPYFTDLVRKYGLVPKEAMPETYNSSSTGTMNGLLGLKVKEMGLRLRNMVREGKLAGEVSARKDEMLAEVYRLLVFNLGEPPREFTWRYETTDTAASGTHVQTYTPQAFFKEAIGDDLRGYVALFNYPGKNYFENYSLRLSRNIYDRPDFTILNLPVDSLRKYTLLSILDSTPVWFACDVGQENYGSDGIMALDIYNYEGILGTDFKLPKGDLIHMQLISPNHAMAFIGVDTANGLAQKWLVENSWGEDRGDKGKWYMYNDWFDRYVFGVVISEKYLPEELKTLAKKKPVELPPWDPMYALNRLK